ncbi:MAG: nucleotidyltransferase family protein [Candidatus Dormibacteraeota bacterium]|nr:nucleotidyltransferase family protein [Candidatus Dormibacteraeota bacterium]
MLYLLSDLDLPLRGRTYREPDGPHAALARGRDLDAAMDHLEARTDCHSLGVLGPPGEIPDLSPLAGRRLLVCESNRSLMREFVEAGLAAGADVEWLNYNHPPLDRVGTWALPVGAVVLAAGAATRMGRNKLLLEIGDQPLIRHVIEAAAEGGCHTVLVVYSDEAVRTAVGNAAVMVNNPDASSGQASSLRVGLQALPPEMEGAMILLGDQPLVGARTVRALLRAWRREGARAAVAASYGEQDGWRPPVVLERGLWPDLMALSGDAGARQLFQNRPELVETVMAGGRPDDVDTPEDYDKIVRLFPRPGR